MADLVKMPVIVHMLWSSGCLCFALGIVSSESFLLSQLQGPLSHPVIFACLHLLGCPVHLQSSEHKRCEQGEVGWTNDGKAGAPSLHGG